MHGGMDKVSICRLDYQIQPVFILCYKKHRNEILGAMKQEKLYLFKRKLKGFFVSCAYVVCWAFPVQKNKIVVCSIEGQSGYSCNPKYIVKKLIEQGKEYKIYWLVNDLTKQFPHEVVKVKNSFWNRIYHLSTAKIWIDNSRKELGTLKRKKQVYIQTWHATLAFKPAGRMRNDFPKIAYWISKNDSKMADYILTNSKWCDTLYPELLFTIGNTLRIGSPRCDDLVNASKRRKGYNEVRDKLEIPHQKKLVLFAPTFRGGSQKGLREIYAQKEEMNYEKLRETLKNKFGGEWIVLRRLHPQLASRMTQKDLKVIDGVIDVTKYDDINEILLGTDAIISDYSSVVFDASYAYIPAFLYAEDIDEFTKDRGNLLWNSNELPFSIARSSEELMKNINDFDENAYKKKLSDLFHTVELIEPGNASEQVVKILEKHMG